MLRSTTAMTGDSSPLLMALVVCAMISVPEGSWASLWLTSRGIEAIAGIDNVLATNTVAGFCSSLLPVWFVGPDEVVPLSSLLANENRRLGCSPFAPRFALARLF